MYIMFRYTTINITYTKDKIETWHLVDCN